MAEEKSTVKKQPSISEVIVENKAATFAKFVENVSNFSELPAAYVKATFEKKKKAKRK